MLVLLLIKLFGALNIREVWCLAQMRDLTSSSFSHESRSPIQSYRYSPKASRQEIVVPVLARQDLLFTWVERNYDGP